MTSQNGLECCYRGCSESKEKPDLRIEVYTDEKGSSIIRAHKKSFNAARNHSVFPDNYEDHGSIPDQAKCVYCGEKLPRLGSHAYCFDAGEYSPPRRYWAHNECMKAVLKSNFKNKLSF